MENIKERTCQLIDHLKGVCQTYGLGNDGNEYKIITQVFLYKFLNDRFGYVAKQNSKQLAQAEHWEVAYSEMDEEEREMLLNIMGSDVPRLEPEHLLANLWNQQSKDKFDEIFDNTMVDIADKNRGIFAGMTAEKTKVSIFEKLTIHVTDPQSRAPFAKALVNKLATFSFEDAFSEHYDYFAAIFEYLISDYNINGGGKYAEYYTPHAIATIMARLLVGDNTKLHSVECYDPSAGTGTLLIALAHQIGEDKCTIFSQDISQRSSKMLRLNLILNGKVDSLPNAIQGDTLVKPFHKEKGSDSLKKFDFVVSNPPFKMDFSDTREAIAAQPQRFWGGVPKVPNKKKESMEIYTLFIQHVLNSLKTKGKGAIVVPTGFLTAQSGVANVVRKRMVDEKWVYGVVSMPSNVFANTGTNVSVVFFDKSGQHDKVVLVDASKLGEDYKDSNGNKKHRLTDREVEKIVATFRKAEKVKDFSVLPTYDEIKEKKYSLSAGQYFDVEIEYVDITPEEFKAKMQAYTDNLNKYFDEGRKLEKEIMQQLKGLRM